MKRVLSMGILLLFVCSFAFVPFDSNLSGDSLHWQKKEIPASLPTKYKSEKAFVLPPLLTQIGEEAFEGTAGEYVFLSDELVSIEGKAFSNMPFLQYVYISPFTEQIAADILYQTLDVIIISAAGSFAEKWALQSGYRFIEAKEWVQSQEYYKEKRFFRQEAVSSLLLLLLAMLLMKAQKDNPACRRSDEGRTMRPQERIELHAIDCCFP